MGALTAFVLAISWGGVVYAWNSATIIGLFVCSAVLFIILGFQQVYTRFTTLSRRIIPVEFFGSRTVLILFSATAAAGAASFVPIYMIPVFFQFTRGDTALDAGIRLLPFIIILVATILANGVLLSKFGYYMPWYAAGGLLAVTGGALMCTVKMDTSVGRIYGYAVILGLGVGLWVQASFSVAQASVKPNQVASAVGFITLSQFAGITIAMAIANTLFLNDCLASISRILPDLSQEQIQASPGSGSRGCWHQQDLCPCHRCGCSCRCAEFIHETGAAVWRLCRSRRCIEGKCPHPLSIPVVVLLLLFPNNIAYVSHSVS
jgi:hypothetical protein